MGARSGLRALGDSDRPPLFVKSIPLKPSTGNESSQKTTTKDRVPEKVIEIDF